MPRVMAEHISPVVPGICFFIFLSSEFRSLNKGFKIVGEDFSIFTPTTLEKPISLTKIPLPLIEFPEPAGRLKYNSPQKGSIILLSRQIPLKHILFPISGVRDFW